MFVVHVGKSYNKSELCGLENTTKCPQVQNPNYAHKQLNTIAIFLRPRVEFKTKPLTQRQVVERNKLYPWTHNFNICEHIFMCKIL
jgi:hypothetical protein